MKTPANSAGSCRRALRRAQALAAATTNGAALLGKSNKLGRIAPGYFADIVAVEGNPLSDITVVLERVRWVMKGGSGGGRQALTAAYSGVFHPEPAMPTASRLRHATRLFTFATLSALVATSALAQSKVADDRR